MRGLILFTAIFLSTGQLLAATHNVLLIGFWAPTNEMLREFSPHPEQNPQGWLGKNWKNLSHDVYAFFPEFSNPQAGSVGEGDFRVDFAATYNDFMEATEKLKPVVIIGYGKGGGPWELEKKCPATFVDWFVAEKIPTVVSEQIKYPIPQSLKEATNRESSLPMEDIKNNINNAQIPGVASKIDEVGGAGTYLCGFLSYLISWYHDEHSSPQDPAYNKAGGFIHVNGTTETAKAAMEITLETTIHTINKVNNR